MEQREKTTTESGALFSSRRVLLFDLDGTLTDPGEGITNSVAYALQKSGVTPPAREALYPFIGPPLLGAFEAYYGFTPEQSRQALAYYREYYAPHGIYENRVYDGIEALLAALKRAGKRLIVATSKPEYFAVKIMEHYDLAKYFERIAGSEMNESRSKKSEVICYALEQCGADAGDAVMIGDRSHDVVGAREAGDIPCIGVLYGYGSRQELEEAGAAEIAETPAALGKLLGV